MELRDQLVLITGGGRGLGRAIACAFARGQASLVINYRSSQAAAEALAAEIGPDRARAVRADVTDPGEVGAMFAAARAAFGRPVTTVVNNALADFSFNGDARSGVDAISWDEFATQLEGSVKGALNTTPGRPARPAGAGLRPDREYRHQPVPESGRAVSRLHRGQGRAALADPDSRG